MHWPPWFLIFGILLLLLGTCHVDIGREIKDINNFTPSDRWLDAYHLSHVCPGTAMPPTSASPVDKQQMLKQLLVERKEAGCTHVYGNLVLDLTGRTLQNLWAGGGMAEFGFAYNQTHTVSGYVHLRLSNFPDEEAVDADKMVNLYGLSTIAGEELYPMMVKKGDKIEVIGCHLVIEYFAFGSNNDNMDLDRYVVGETLDLSNVRICSFRTKHNNADPSIPERDYTPDKYGIYEGKDNAQWSLGVRIKGVDKDGKLKVS
ncbi:hypothetical protein M3Y98_00887700 [Aphelenchoides besseyi]|nr:hypothetical protein M3Y98_00887700 [Aphelenchoides besseyi]